MTADHAALMHEIESAVEQILGVLKPVDACWQPSDLLPDMGKEGWREEVEALREEARALTDEMLVVLVGNVITEEALPSYQTAINRHEGIADQSGCDAHAWAKWSRGWTAEENRHGDVTRLYLYLSGRVDMRSVEVTLQHLIRNGFDTRAQRDPYKGMAYATVQEHATKVCWQQMGRLAGSVGATRLHKICGLVAADEARHERAYTLMLTEVLRRDPAGCVEALREVLGNVVMPARTMTDGRDTRLFTHFADVGQRVGVYTTEDYVSNVEQLIRTLGLGDLTGLSGTACEARDQICSMPARFRELARQPARAPRPVPFLWIHDRCA